MQFCRNFYGISENQNDALSERLPRVKREATHGHESRPEKRICAAYLYSIKYHVFV